MTKKNAVSVNRLTKIYAKNSINSVVALNELNLEVKEGEIFGLIMLYLLYLEKVMGYLLGR